MKNIKIGDLVRYAGIREHLGIGVVTAIRNTRAIHSNRFVFDVLWACGRHSAHSSGWIVRMKEGA